jgi:mRNA interferase MazF
MRRGDIRWYTFAQPDKRRPVLLLTRNEVIDSLNEVNVVPAPRTILGCQPRSCSLPRTGCPSLVR